jgi:hypothetical protein
MSAIRTLAASAALILVLGVSQAPAQVILSLGGNQAAPYAAPIYGNQAYGSPYGVSSVFPQATYPYATAPRYTQSYATSPYYANSYNQGYYTTPNGTVYNPYQGGVGRSYAPGNDTRYYSSGYNGAYGQPGYNYGAIPGTNYRSYQLGPVRILAPR